MVARKTLFAASLSLLFLVCKSQVKVSNDQPVVESGKPAPVGKFNEKYQVTRKTLLQKMLDVVNKMNE